MMCGMASLQLLTQYINQVYLRNLSNTQSSLSPTYAIHLITGLNHLLFFPYLGETTTSLAKDRGGS